MAHRNQVIDRFDAEIVADSLKPYIHMRLEPEGRWMLHADHAKAIAALSSPPGVQAAQVSDAELSQLRDDLSSLAWSSHPKGYDYAYKMMRRVFELLKAAQSGSAAHGGEVSNA